jgi:hypothetical protein
MKKKPKLRKITIEIPEGMRLGQAFTVVYYVISNLKKLK